MAFSYKNSVCVLEWFELNEVIQRNIQDSGLVGLASVCRIMLILKAIVELIMLSNARSSHIRTAFSVIRNIHITVCSLVQKKNIPNTKTSKTVEIVITDSIAKQSSYY